MTDKTTLIAGFGNVLLSDDGFGVEVVKRLAASRLPSHVEIIDVGIAGMHFVLRLMEGFEEVIVVDAVKRGQRPGMLYVFRPSGIDINVYSEAEIDPHCAEPERALKLAKALGMLPDNVQVIGCEPKSCHVGMRLSVPVNAAVECAVETIRAMVGDVTSGLRSGDQQPCRGPYRR